MAGVKLTITENDKGLDVLRAALSDMGIGSAVRVGVFADAKSGGEQHDPESGLTNVELAAIHEYGAPEAGIPERPFIRQTFEGHRHEYMAIVRKLLPRVLEGKFSARQLFDLVGQKMVADVNTTVRGAHGPGFSLEPLKPATIARKGSSRPLIDTGRLLASVTYVVTISRRPEWLARTSPHSTSSA